MRDSGTDERGMTYLEELIFPGNFRRGCERELLRGGVGG